MTKSDLLFDVASGVAVVTLNRPDAMNALTLLMIHALTE
jgi:enoyl-CoA hydratase/carnithine racemase